MDNFKEIVEEYGAESLDETKKYLLRRFNGEETVSEAVRYFTEVTLKHALPVFPAMMALSCEAVGGNARKTAGLSKALMLLASTADIHDDIIDKSNKKNGNLTVFGKYGEATSILVGDTLLVEGMALLQKQCRELPENKADKVLNLVTTSILELSIAEVMETQFWGQIDCPPTKFLEIIEMKATVHELHCKIGGILGEGSDSEVESLGQFGRYYGMVATIVEEFLDLQELNELKNRLHSECPPLPIIYVSQNLTAKQELLKIIDDKIIDKKKANKINEVVSNSVELSRLRTETKRLVESGVHNLDFIKSDEIRRKLGFLLLTLEEVY
jgi:geranylgeranyl pyrophosphate synthase